MTGLRRWRNMITIPLRSAIAPMSVHLKILINNCHGCSVLFLHSSDKLTLSHLAVCWSFTSSALVINYLPSILLFVAVVAVCCCFSCTVRVPLVAIIAFIYVVVCTVFHHTTAKYNIYIQIDESCSIAIIYIAFRFCNSILFDNSLCRGQRTNTSKRTIDDRNTE